MDNAVGDLTKITGQKPLVTRARKSVATFKVRDGLAIGAKVTLRGARMYEFLDRLVNDRDAAYPRLPRRERALVRRPRQLQLRRQGTDHFPRDRLRPDRCDPRHGHHDHDDGEATTKQGARCSKPSISRSASKSGTQYGQDIDGQSRDEAREAGEALCGEAREAEGNHPQADVDAGGARGRGRCSCRRCRATRARAASAIAAQSPAARAVSTASSVWAAPSCAKRRCAAKFRASARPAGNSWNHWSTHMSMTDPIADFLTRIRNGQSSGKPEVNVPTSKVKLAIAKVLKDEGYIEDFAATDAGRQADAGGAAEVLPGPPGHRPPRARQPSRPARLQGQGRAAVRSSAVWASRSSRRRRA